MSIPEKEYNRLEVAIDKLTLVATNLDKLLGVHEERLNRQEKQMNSYENTLEKRREVYENAFSDVYDKIRESDKEIIDKNDKSLKEIIIRVNKIEKTQLLYVGGFAVITFLLTYGQSFLHIIMASAATK